MSTRSSISIEMGNKIYSIYCHNDGYISHNGEILTTHYSDRRDVNRLINLGDLSALNETIDTCVAYMRDRGESNCEADEGVMGESLADYQYNYLYTNDDVWVCFDCHGEMISLENL